MGFFFLRCGLLLFAPNTAHHGCFRHGQRKTSKGKRPLNFSNSGDSHRHLSPHNQQRRGAPPPAWWKTGRVMKMTLWVCLQSVYRVMKAVFWEGAWWKINFTPCIYSCSALLSIANRYYFYGVLRSLLLTCIMAILLCSFLRITLTFLTAIMARWRVRRAPCRAQMCDLMVFLGLTRLFLSHLRDSRKFLIAYAWLKNYRSILECAVCAFQTTKSYCTYMLIIMAATRRPTCRSTALNTSRSMHNRNHSTDHYRIE